VVFVVRAGVEPDRVVQRYGIGSDGTDNGFDDRFAVNTLNDGLTNELLREKRVRVVEVDVFPYRAEAGFPFNTLNTIDFLYQRNLRLRVDSMSAILL
jgi:hypothetical protein